MNEEERIWYRAQCTDTLKEICDIFDGQTCPVTIYDCWCDLQAELRSVKGNLARMSKRYAELKDKG